MQITLPSDVEKVIREKVQSGAFANPQDVVRAALAALGQQDEFGTFEPDELNELLSEGEASIERDGTLDGDEALAARRQGRHR